MAKSWTNDKTLLKKMAKYEKARLQRERAHNRRVQRTFILSCFGLTDPKYFPEECKHCNNFYCTFCFKCKFLTKNDDDPDLQARTEEVTKNFVDYENMCAAIVREYII